MSFALDRSVACLTIWMLASTGCVSTLNIDAVRGAPTDVREVASALPPYPDVANLVSSEPSAPYRVGPLDEVAVRVFGRPDLGSQAESRRGGATSTVGYDGRIDLPLIGAIEVAGLTRLEISQLVRQRYARVVENAQVEVQIVRCGSKPVDLVGAFAAPGRYYLCEHLRTLGDFVGAAEGLTPEANPARGTLTRGGATFRLYPPQGSSDFDVPLQNGDVVHFPLVGEQRVYVFGQVASPGPYPIPPQGLTIVELLAKAEGWSEETSTGSIYLLRPTEEMVVAYEIELDELMQGPGVPLADGDRLYIAPTLLTRWSWWWRQAIPSFFFPRYSL